MFGMSIFHCDRSSEARSLPEWGLRRQCDSGWQILSAKLHFINLLLFTAHREGKEPLFIMIV